MFLDYDGTLSPIVNDPDRAFMSDEVSSLFSLHISFFPSTFGFSANKNSVLCLYQMRKAVRKLARSFPTAIVSGRCRDKVYSFVRLAELYYAGSHGMDIKGPTRSSKYNKVRNFTIPYCIVF